MIAVLTETNWYTTTHSLKEKEVHATKRKPEALEVIVVLWLDDTSIGLAFAFICPKATVFTTPRPTLS
jgi:hypothetical protein